ncbi:hypothetical protein GQ53DRAFT_803831 [Thozetella sp. PMI_491]|nr:hypothetical protein GQ53DRAFT_803831 [Thozetella sp. PMI_491]
MGKGIDRTDRVYARCFQRRKEGHAIYEGVSAEDMRPGVCGFFDDDGDWKQIVDTNKPSDLEAGGFTQLTGVTTSIKPVKESWGMMASSSMKKLKLETRLEGGQPGIANVAVTIGYENTADEGAVLLTEGLIQHHVADPDYRYLDWMEQNVAALAKIPPVRKRGFWIITKTYTAEKRALAVSSSKGSKFTWRVDATVFESGGAGPTAEWWSGHKDDCWITHEHGKGVVLFISGYQWTPSVLPWKPGDIVTKKERQKHLGDGGTLDSIETVFTDEDGKPKLLRLQPETISSGSAGTRVSHPSTSGARGGYVTSRVFAPSHHIFSNEVAGKSTTSG